MSKKVNLKVLTISFITVLVVSVIALLFASTKDLFAYNDKLFLVSIVFATIGALISIVAKSRMHYYVHLKSKFSGKVKDDHAFEEEEHRREMHTIFGISLSLSGLTGLIMSTAITFI